MSRFFFNLGAPDRLLQLLERRQLTLHSLQDHFTKTHNFLTPLFADEHTDRAIASIKKKLEAIDMEIVDLIQSGHLDRLKTDLKKFESEYPDRNRTVFLMMKFPSSVRRPEDDVLEAIFKRIRSVCINSYNMRIARADKFTASSYIWDNAQVHAIGSGYGIALIENKHTDEFNPNVAMEAGYMAALGRPVLLLIEKEFPYSRADLQGRIYRSFSWGSTDSDLDTVEQAIREWFYEQGIPSRP